MKSASFTRPIDEMGRFVLPIEIRRALDLQDKDRLEIYIEGNRIVLQKQQTTCSFCNRTEQLLPFGESFVCRSCLNELKKL